MKKIFLILFLLCSPCLAEVQFDNTDDFLSCGTTDGVITENGALTISAWINFAGAGEGNNGRIISKETAGGVGPRFYTTLNTKPKLQFTVSGSTDMNVSAVTDSITTGTWYHVLLTWDGSTNANNVHFYYNGVESTPHTDNTNGVTPTDNSANTLMIGNRGNNDRTANATISDLAIWNVELNAQEIAQLSASRLKRIPLQIRSSNLKAYWPLDEKPDGENANGTTFIDASGNGNNCTADDGANNTGMTAKAEEYVSYP